MSIGLGAGNAGADFVRKDALRPIGPDGGDHVEVMRTSLHAGVPVVQSIDQGAGNSTKGPAGGTTAIDVIARDNAGAGSPFQIDGMG